MRFWNSEPKFSGIFLDELLPQFNSFASSLLFKSKSKRFFLSVLQLNTIFSAHISSFKIFGNHQIPYLSSFPRIFVLALKIVQKRRYTNLTFGHVIILLYI